MSTENQNWLHDLFISEAKAAQDYHNRGGEEIPTQEKTVDITENGTVVVEPDEGHTMSKVTVDIDIPDTPTQEKSVDVTENGTVVIEPDAGYALSKATAKVNVPTSGGVDKIQRWIELNGNSANYFFYLCKATSVDELMLGVDTSKVTDMSYMFAECSNLTTVPLFDTSNVTNMSYMLYKCSNLTTVPLFDTSKVTNMTYMFNKCFNLTTVPSFDASKVTNMSYMFTNCYELAECWIRNIKTVLQVGSGTSWGHLLTLESLLSLCKECRNTGSQKTLTIGSANLEKLANVYVKLIDITDEMRAEDDLIDEKSPFVVCESTDDGAMLIADYMTTKKWVLK